MDKLDSITFDDFLRVINPFEKKGSCTFDLSGIQLITPSALVQLAAACYGLSRERRDVTVVLDDINVITYLGRVAFLSTLESVAQIEPSHWVEVVRSDHLRGTNPMLIEVTMLERGSSLPGLLDQIVDVLRNRLRYRKYDAFDVATAVSEICQNTFDHNRNTRGFIAMQVYGKGSRRFLEIGVADYGDGLARTLSRNPKNPAVQSDLGAIKLATQPGTSEHDDPTRGTGLYHLLEIAYRHEGSVQIRSGEHKVRFRMDKQQGWGFQVPFMPGVQIALALNTKKRG
jgi:anti-sigma regulatory factor (Ser/Thr protein kinase)